MSTLLHEGSATTTMATSIYKMHDSFKPRLTMHATNQEPLKWSSLWQDCNSCWFCPMYPTSLDQCSLNMMVPLVTPHCNRCKMTLAKPGLSKIPTQPLCMISLCQFLLQVCFISLIWFGCGWEITDSSIKEPIANSRKWATMHLHHIIHLRTGTRPLTQLYHVRMLPGGPLRWEHGHIHMHCTQYVFLLIWCIKVSASWPLGVNHERHTWEKVALLL